MRQFLEFIVCETLAGRTGQLCEYGIAIPVFDRDESFEPGLDPIVRNDAQRLRQKLLEYYQRSRREDGDQVVIDIPKGGYILVFNALSPPHRPSAGRQYRQSRPVDQWARSFRNFGSKLR